MLSLLLLLLLFVLLLRLLVIGLAVACGQPDGGVWADLYAVCRPTVVAVPGRRRGQRILRHSAQRPATSQHINTHTRTPTPNPRKLCAAHPGHVA